MAVFKFRNLKSGQATPIPPGEFTIGRADDAYIHLEDGSVSRRHAQIINNDAGFFIEDLGSANGTAARGSYITRRMSVNFGDLVYIGSVPFRIDPEVEGEVDAAPSAGLRTSNRAYIRRDTERLPPNMSGTAPTTEPISPEKLSAPEVNPITDADAGELNAITMLESGSAPEQPEENHKTEPAQKAILAEITPIRSSFSVPTPISQRHAPAQPSPSAVLTQPQASHHQSAPTTIIAPPLQMTPTPVPAPTATPVLGRSWLLAIFLAGMGAGLLIGLCFARLFIEMGGKAASLP